MLSKHIWHILMVLDSLIKKQSVIFPYFFEQNKKVSPFLWNACRTYPKTRRWKVDSYFSLRAFRTNIYKNFPTWQVKKVFLRCMKSPIITAFLWWENRKEIKRFWKKQSSKWLHNFAGFFLLLNMKILFPPPLPHTHAVLLK